MFISGNEVLCTLICFMHFNSDYRQLLIKLRIYNIYSTTKSTPCQSLFITHSNWSANFLSSDYQVHKLVQLEGANIYTLRTVAWFEVALFNFSLVAPLFKSV